MLRTFFCAVLALLMVTGLVMAQGKGKKNKPVTGKVKTLTFGGGRRRQTDR